MFSVKKAAVAAIAGFALSFLLSIVATGKFGMAFLRGILFCVLFAAGEIAIDFLNSRFLSGEGGDFASLVPDIPQKKAGAKTAGNLVSIVIDDANLTEEPSPPNFDVQSNGALLKNLDSKEKKTPEKQQEKPAEVPPGTQQSAVQEKADRGGTSNVDSGKPEAKKAAKKDGASRGGGGKAGVGKASDKKASVNTAQAKQDDDVSPQESETFKPMQLDAISGGAKKTESASERKHERLQQIDALPDFAALSNGSDVDRDEGLISDSEFAESDPEDEDSEAESVSSAPRGNVSVDYDSETIASAIRTLLKRDE